MHKRVQRHLTVVGYQTTFKLSQKPKEQFSNSYNLSFNRIAQTEKKYKPKKVRDLLFPPCCFLRRPAKIPIIPLVWISFSEPDC